MNEQMQHLWRPLNFIVEARTAYRNHWQRYAIYLLIAVLIVLGGVRLLAEPPLINIIIYPLYTVFYEVAWFVFWPVLGVMVTAMILFLPYLISEYLLRLNAQDEQFIRPDLQRLMILLVLAALGYWLLFPAVNAPQQIDSLRLEDHTYYLLRDDNGRGLEYYTLLECDGYGIVCTTLLNEKAHPGNGWSASARLDEEDSLLQVHNRGRIIRERDEDF